MEPYESETEPRHVFIHEQVGECDLLLQRTGQEESNATRTVLMNTALPKHPTRSPSFQFDSKKT